MVDNFMTKDLEPKTVNESGSPSSDRIASPEAARQVWGQLREQTRLVASLDVRVMAIRNGNPPWPQTELTELGQGWRANLNTREMKAAINAKAEAAYELHLDTATRIEVRVNPLFSRQAEAVPEEDWGMVVSEEYTDLHARWKKGYFNIDLTTRESLSYGLGLMVFPDEWNWQPRAFKKCQFYFDPADQALPDEIEICGLRDEMRAGELFEIISDPVAAKKEGWNVAAIKALLARVFLKGESQSTLHGDGNVDVWAWVEQRYKNRDTDIQMRAFEKIPLVHLLVQEVDDQKVTQITITESMGQKDEFIRKVPKRFDRMSQVLWLLPYSYEDGFLGSLRGLGHELYTYAEVSNRLVCSALDGGMIAGGLLLEAQSGFDAEQLAIIRNGPVTVVPPGLKAVQSTFAPPITQLIALRGMLRDITTSNLGIFPIRADSSIAQKEAEKTARQIVSEENKEARYEKNKANFEYLQWQVWHEEIFRRLTRMEYVMSERKLPGQQEAREFIRNCVARGVPIELFFTPNALTIKIARVIGLGSPAARMDVTNQLLSVSGRMDETGRRTAEREWTAARVGYFNVDKFFPLRNRDKIPTNEMSIATLENNDFREGRPVPVGSDQIHVIHLDQVHFPLVQSIIETVQQSPEKADYPAIYKLLRVMLPHINEHIQFLLLDPSRKNYTDKAKQVLLLMLQFFKQVEQKVVTDDEARQQLAADQMAEQMQLMQDQLSQENQVKLREIELKGTLERMKQESLNQMRQDKTQGQMAIKQWQATQQAALESWKAAEAAKLDAFIASQKILMEQLKTQAKVSSGGAS